MVSNLEERVREPYRFAGLATYLNSVATYSVDSGSVSYESDLSEIDLKNMQWLAVVGRFNVALMYGTSDQSGASTQDRDQQRKNRVLGGIRVVQKPNLHDLDSELSQLRYANLWVGLRILALAAESALEFLHKYVSNNWAVVLLVFAAIVKILLLPLSILTSRSQKQVDLLGAKLAPTVSEVRSTLRGEEAHNRIMQAHKELGITPFYTMKPMLLAFLQFPVLIAIFNALGEMPQFSGQSFLWIEDLAYPDYVYTLQGHVPLLGNKLSLLPLVMTLVTLLSIPLIDTSHISHEEYRRRKFKLVLMAAAFFFLFYPFPAVMVLYWTFATFWQLALQKLAHW
ncbi:MAG: membrane protein insertase YidC [Halioglobus sp.]